MKKSLFIALSLLVMLVPALILSACDNTPPTPTKAIPTTSEGTLTFSPSQLPEAAAGQPYHTTITITGNKTPVGNMSIATGTLPAGLELTYKQIDSFASISGTPQKAGSYKFTFSAQCIGTNLPGQEGTRQYEIVVK